MDKQQFDSLSKAERIGMIRDAFLASTVDVLEGNKKRYHNIAKFVAPDLNADCEALATEALAAVNDMNDNGPKAVAVSVAKSIETDTHSYLVGEFLGAGDIAHCYEATGENGQIVVVKSAPGFNDNLKREADALTRLNAGATFDSIGVNYIPMLVDELPGLNVLAYSDKFLKPSEMYTLTQIASSFDNKIPAKAIGWIMPRLLGALIYAHDLGVVHGAITPDNIIIEPLQHKVALIDWVHSSIDQRPIDSLSVKWQHLYPPEVMNKPLGVPAFDTYMVGSTISHVARDLSEPILNFLSNLMYISSRGRPASASTLIDIWYDVVRNQMKWPRGEFIPLDFAPTTSAGTIDWTWFD